jgi:TP901 family phage tail tape measure protein
MAKIKDEDLRLNIIVNGDAGRKQILDLEKQMKDLSSTTKDTEKALRKLEQTGKVGSQEYARLNSTLLDQKKRLAECKAEYGKLQNAVSLDNKTLAELKSHLKATSAALGKAVPGTENWKRLSDEVKRTKDRMKELSGQASATGSAISKFSKVAAAIAAVTGAIEGLAKAFSKIADFEQANADLSTIIGKSVQEIEALTYSAMELGRTTEYTASQVTELQTELAKLGFNEGDIIKMQESVLHFATALGTNLADAAAMAGSTLRMFGLQTSDTEDALSVLVQGANASALGFEYYQTAMAIVGPVAKTFGFSLRDTVALLGTLANSGFDASSAATATRNILLNLADSSGKLAVALGKPVKTFPELMEGLAALKEKGVDLNTTLELTDKRSVSAFNAFLDSADSALSLRDSLDDVNGVLQETAEVRINTVEGSIKLLQSAWEGLILSFKESAGPIKTCIDWLTKLVEAMADGITAGGKQGFLKEYSEELKILTEGLSPEEARSLVSERRDAFASEVERAKTKAASLNRFERRALATNNKVREERLAAFDLAAAPYLDVSEPTPGGTETGPSSSTVSSGDDKESKKQWSLATDEAYLKAKAELTRQYNDKEIASQETYNEKLYELEVASLTARLAAHKEKGAARAKIEADLQDKIKKHTDDALKKQKENEKKAAELAKEGAAVIAAAETDKTKSALAAEETRYAAEVKKFKETKVLYENQAAVLESIEKKHQNNLLKIKQESWDRELTRLETRHNVEKQHISSVYTGKISTVAPNSREAKKYEVEKNYATRESDLAYLNELLLKLEQIKADGGFDGLQLPQDELDKYNLKLEQTKTKINELVAAKNKTDGGLFSGTGKGSLFGVSQSDWNSFFANIETGKNKAETLSTALNAIGGFAQEGFQLANQAIALTNAKEEASFKEYQKNNEKKKKSLESRYDAGLVSEEQYNAQVEAMEEEEDAKQEEMELKQAKRTKAINLIQSIINTALSVTKTIAQWGWPAGAIPAGIVAAFGAAQTAMIAAQPVTAGAEEGGFINTIRSQDGKKFKARLSPDKRGFVSSPTILVGENGGEYVIPAEGLGNPSLLPFINTLETARRTGTLHSLNFEAVYPVGSAVGRASGGYATGGAYVGSQAAIPFTADRRLSAAIETLNKRLSSPIRADVSMLGKNGIIEQTERYNRAKSRSK